jgi:iron only hydrogenase large subunit-like protein
VKSIKFSDGQANILADECILCGQCFVACPQNAKEIRNDVELVTNAIKSGRTVIASVAPSFISEFKISGINEIEKCLKQLGFSYAFETAVGAELVKKQYENLIFQKENKVIISSCCHTVNTLIQKYYPHALKFLADVISPMHAHAKLIKEQFPESYIVFIGPCISKKDELLLIDELDCVLTFEEFSDWLESENITLEEDNVSSEDAYSSRFFPKAGGIIDSMNTENSGYNYYVVDGMDSCIDVLKNLHDGDMMNCFIEMSACAGGCINGPATKSFLKNRLDCIKRVDEYAVEKNHDKGLECNFLLEKKISYVGTHKIMPGEAEIRAILKKMGKTLPEHELNCQSCGYNTCHDKAVAIYQGKADLTMCLPYLKERAESFSDKIINNTPNSIIAVDDDLNIIEMNTAACKMFNLSDSHDFIKTSVVTIINPADIIMVMETGRSVFEKKLVLNEYRKIVEQSIIYDSEYHLSIIIMKDITQRENSEQAQNEIKMKTVDIADKVIDKQMRVVQEIASLLGETAAETQIALTKLKETFLK